MIRALLALVAGYISIIALNSFFHLIVSVYFNTELLLSGISQLPSSLWIIGFTLVQFLWGLFAGFFTTTLARENSSIAILGLLLIIVATSFINYSVLSGREPLWYLITAPVLKMAGIYLGFTLQSNKMVDADHT